jgi:cell division protein FtsZ
MVVSFLENFSYYKHMNKSSFNDKMYFKQGDNFFYQNDKLNNSFLPLENSISTLEKNENKEWIRVIGVGGMGGNAVQALAKNPISKYLKIIAVNTDKQALNNISIPEENKVLIFRKDSEAGIGAGANPELAREAAENCLEQIMSHIIGAKMVFVIAGGGKGTGNGASPVIVEAIKKQGILVTVIITTPFAHEGKARMITARKAIEQLKEYSDTLMVVSNENLLLCSTEQTSFIDAINLSSEVLFTAIKGLTELISIPGLINLDFADVCAAMKDKGYGLIGFGKGNNSNEGREEAIENAISNPLMDNTFSIVGAGSVLLHIIGGVDLGLNDVKEIANRVQERVNNDECQLIMGTTIDPNIDHNEIQILVIATGLVERVLDLKQLNNKKETIKKDSLPISGPNWDQEEEAEETKGFFSKLIKYVGLG